MKSCFRSFVRKYQVLRARLSRVAGFDSANHTHERAGRLDSRSRDGILVLKTDGLGPPGGNHRAWLRPGPDISRGGTQKRRVSLAGSWNTQRQATYARPEPTIPVVDQTGYKYLHTYTQAATPGTTAPLHLRVDAQTSRAIFRSSRLPQRCCRTTRAPPPTCP